MVSAHPWQFAPRFRRHAFGWRSDLPIQRIKEALSEIKQVGRKDPVLAAEGAVLLLEKLSPALEQVDSSSGAIGTAVYRAIETLVPIMAKAKVVPDVRQRWLERLWQALQDDQIPYIEGLGEYWGALCVTAELASHWADRFLPTVKPLWSPKAKEHGFFTGTTACLSALYSAGRYLELLALLEHARFQLWHYREWGVKALVALGKKAEAIRYAEECQDLNAPRSEIARTCEEILLSSGLVEEAYRRYALEAHPGTTNLATFRSIAKTYPHKDPEEILRDLIARSPGAEGKWFAAAKDAGLFDLAAELATRSPSDPRTLIRAAKDFAESRPEFALASGLAALHWMALGRGYDITRLDVLDAYAAVLLAATKAGMTEPAVKEQIRARISGSYALNPLVQSVLGNQLPS